MTRSNAPSCINCSSAKEEQSVHPGDPGEQREQKLQLIDGPRRKAMATPWKLISSRG